MTPPDGKTASTPDVEAMPEAERLDEVADLLATGLLRTWPRRHPKVRAFSAGIPLSRAPRRALMWSRKPRKETACQTPS